MEAFVKAHGITTLDDFVYLVDGKAWETSLQDMLSGIEALKNKRLILARFKAAYESGLSAIKHSQAQPKSDEVTDALAP